MGLSFKQWLSAFSLKKRTANLRLNDTLQLKHFSTHCTICAQVMGVMPGIIKVGIPLDNGEYSVHDGDSLVLSLNRGKQIYIYRGLILHTTDGIPLELEIEIQNAEKHKNLRKYKRYWVSFAAGVIRSGQEQAIEAVVHDISLGGVRFTCAESLDLDESIVIDIVVEQYVSFLCRGRITRQARTPGYMEYGLVFTNISDANRHILQKTITQLKESGVIV